MAARSSLGMIPAANAGELLFLQKLCQKWQKPPYGKVNQN